MRTWIIESMGTRARLTVQCKVRLVTAPTRNVAHNRLKDYEVGLVGHAAREELTGLGVERDLSRTEDPPVDHDRL